MEINQNTPEFESCQDIEEDRSFLFFSSKSRSFENGFISKIRLLMHSTHEVLCAYLTWMYIRLFGYQAPLTCTQATMIDMRTRLTGISPAFTGNATFVVNTAKVRAGDSADKIAAAIHQGLALYKQKPSPLLEQLIS